DGEVIAIDGKTLRGSYNRDDRRSTIHMVSAFATANGVVMGQVKTAEKSNEITAIPELLELLDLKGCLVVTIDAMGCQKEIAQAIVNKDADYLLALKANQKNLHLAVCDTLKEATSLPDQENAVIEKGHGRFEIREYHVMNAETVSCQFPDWPELKTIGVAISYRATKGGKESIQFRYYISSADLSSEKFANAVRSHWGIENKLHWVLDTAMNEDGCQIYRGNAAENLACTR
ncbi:ISAs1 family transposase, partial [uncultured Photobacterium sp.]|uniref:ISAs1 family transposase n=1 Tax=uncultured Photobacterium sp. TaxID=173973 RepID=UPI00260BC50B